MNEGFLAGQENDPLAHFEIGMQVRVARSGGSIETDWVYLGVGSEGVEVANLAGDKSMTVPKEEFLKLNLKEIDVTQSDTEHIDI